MTKEEFEAVRAEEARNLLAWSRSLPEHRLTFEAWSEKEDNDTSRTKD